MTRLIYHEKREELDNEAANIIEKAINRTLKEKPNAVLAICGGRSVAGIFGKIRQKTIPWQKVHIFFVDERLVAIAHPDANYNVVYENMLDKLLSTGKLPEQNIHPFVYDETSRDFGLAAYEKDLRTFGGRFDVVLLSSGEDGHVGALYPEHDSIRSNAEYFISMEDSPKLPSRRMSSSRKLLLRTGTAVLLFRGDAKRDALRSFLDIRENFYTCPAKLVQDIKDSHVLTDLKL
jgi:6-phosphogluconolactonase